MEHSRASPVPAHLNKDKMPNLDGIRAMACLFVIISHMPWPIDIVLIGSVGVGVFFVLSGFLMGYLYGHTEFDSTSVIKYSIARFSRIAPIYWVVISVCVLLSQFLPSDFPLYIEGITSISRHYFFSGNVNIFWSIPLEVQYYVFFLFVWWCLSNRALLPYAMPLLIVICALLILTHSYWPNLSVPDKLHYFLAGTIAGLLPRRNWDGMRNRTILCLMQLVALIIIFAPLVLFKKIDELYNSIEMSIALGIAIYLLSFNSRWTGLLFATPLMRKIGQASFSIYLMHILVFYFGGHLLGLRHGVYSPLWIPLGVFAVVLPMIASHYIEMPLQRMTRKWLEVVIPSKFGRALPQPN
jgi:peptidoglycan/LPS O-acetylase OafA/YrhL